MNAASKPYVSPLTKSTLPSPRSAKRPVVYYTYDRHGDPVEIDSMLARQPPRRDLPEVSRQHPRGDLDAATASAGTSHPLGDLHAGTSDVVGSHPLGDLSAETSRRLEFTQLGLGFST